MPIPGGVYDSFKGRAPAEPGAAIAMSHQPTEAMVSAAPPLLGSPVLVVGVLSFNGTTARRRRDIQRRACGADADAALRFVMVASEEAAAEATALGDVMQVALPQNGSRWVHVAGKLMLQNALLRFASSLPACVRFIARADDDALFNAGAIARLLLPSTAAAQSERIVFGPFKNVYAWHVESMMASCWDYGLSGSLRCINSFKATHANDTLVGPFHFAGGPFIAYSRPLAVELATLLRHSGTEAYVLSPARTERPLLHPWYGTYRGPEHPRHPSNTTRLVWVNHSSVHATMNRETHKSRRCSPRRASLLPARTAASSSRPASTSVQSTHFVAACSWRAVAAVEVGPDSVTSAGR